MPLLLHLPQELVSLLASCLRYIHTICAPQAPSILPNGMAERPEGFQTTDKVTKRDDVNSSTQSATLN